MNDRGYYAGILFAVAIFGFIFRPIIGYFKDVPLGPVNVRETNPAKMRANDQANIQAQNRMYERLRYLWVLGVVCTVAAIIVLVV